MEKGSRRIAGGRGGELGAGGSHGELDQAFAGEVRLLVQVNHREPVEQRAKADREVPGRYLKAERTLLLTAQHGWRYVAEELAGAGVAPPAHDPLPGSRVKDACGTAMRPLRAP
jgi:hypothetical protein